MDVFVVRNIQVKALVLGLQVVEQILPELAKLLIESIWSNDVDNKSDLLGLVLFTADTAFSLLGFITHLFSFLIVFGTPHFLWLAIVVGIIVISVTMIMLIVVTTSWSLVHTFLQLLFFDLPC